MRGVVVAALLCGCFSKPGPPLLATDGPAANDGAADSGSGSACGWVAKVVDTKLDITDMVEPTMSIDTLDLIYQQADSTYEARRPDTSSALVPTPWSVEDANEIPIQLDLMDPSGMWVRSTGPSGMLHHATRMGNSSLFMLDTEFAVPPIVVDASFSANNTVVVYTTDAGDLRVVDTSANSDNLLLTAEAGVTYASPAIHGTQLVYSRVENGKGALWSGTCNGTTLLDTASLGISTAAASDIGSILFGNVLYFVRGSSPRQFMVATNPCN